MYLNGKNFGDNSELNLKIKKLKSQPNSPTSTSYSNLIENSDEKSNKARSKVEITAKKIKDMKFSKVSSTSSIGKVPISPRRILIKQLTNPGLINNKQISKLTRFNSPTSKLISTKSYNIKSSNSPKPADVDNKSFSSRFC